MVSGAKNGNRTTNNCPKYSDKTTQFCGVRESIGSGRELILNQQCHLWKLTSYREDEVTGIFLFSTKRKKRQSKEKQELALLWHNVNLFSKLYLQVLAHRNSSTMGTTLTLQVSPSLAK